MKSNSKAAETNNRTGSLNLRINAKLKYLAEIAARAEEKSLYSYIEAAIADRLRNPFSGEPSIGTEPATRAPLWGESLWDEDEATRFFRLATTYPNLLNPPQTRLWALLSGSLIRNEGKITLKNFKEYYNDPSINRAHLKDGEE